MRTDLRRDLDSGGVNSPSITLLSAMGIWILDRFSLSVMFFKGGKAMLRFAHSNRLTRRLGFFLVISLSGLATNVCADIQWQEGVIGLTNPGFEESSSTQAIPGWERTGPNVTITTTDGEFHGGSAGLKITATPGVGQTTGPWQMAWQDWKGYVPGATYQLSFWGKVDSTEGLKGRVPVLTIPPPGGGYGLIFALSLIHISRIQIPP